MGSSVIWSLQLLVQLRKFETLPDIANRCQLTVKLRSVISNRESGHLPDVMTSSLIELDIIFAFLVTAAS